MLNMFRTLIYPSSGACDYSVELPRWSYCSWFDVCWSFCVVGLEWYPCCRLNSRKLLIMDILISETCWAHKKWNKIASNFKLVFYSSTITMMHGPINVRNISSRYRTPCIITLHMLLPSLFGECHIRPLPVLHNTLQFAQPAPFNLSFYSHNRQHFCPYGFVTDSSL